MSAAGAFIELGTNPGATGSLDISNDATFTAASLMTVGVQGNGVIALNGGTLIAQDGLSIGNLRRRQRHNQPAARSYRSATS